MIGANKNCKEKQKKNQSRILKQIRFLHETKHIPLNIGN